MGACGRAERVGDDYVDNGTAKLSMIAGWWAVKATEKRTAVDFAEVIRRLVDQLHEVADKAVLVMDNLNTHKVASLDAPSRPNRPGGSPRGWRSTTRRSTAHD